MNSKTKYKFSTLLLVSILLLLTLGYAYLTQNLNINGTSRINNASWNIYLNNVQVTEGSVSVSTPVIDTNKTTVTYSVHLSKPGDFYEFIVDAKNDGTIDAMIDNISSKLNNVEITSLPSYLEYSVTYGDGKSIQDNHLLKANYKETYKVRVGYKQDISSSQLPSTAQELNLSFSINYVQANEDAVERVQIVYTVNTYDEGLISLGQAIPNTVTQYRTAEQALNAFRTAKENNHINTYLKHRVEDGIVTESYVEFVLDDYVAGNVQGITQGTYSLRGLDTFDTTTTPWTCKPQYFNSTSSNCESPYYEENKQTLLRAYGAGNCRVYSTYTVCDSAEADLEGHVDYEDAGSCVAEHQSYCW